MSRGGGYRPAPLVHLGPLVILNIPFVSRGTDFGSRFSFGTEGAEGISVGQCHNGWSRPPLPTSREVDHPHPAFPCSPALGSCQPLGAGTTGHWKNGGKGFGPTSDPPPVGFPESRPALRQRGVWG